MRGKRTTGVLGEGDRFPQSWIDLDWASSLQTNAYLGNHFRVRLTGNCTLLPPYEPFDGQRILWRFEQDATGGRTVTLNSSGFVSFLATGAGLVRSKAGSISYVEAVYDGAEEKWEVLPLTPAYSLRKVGVATLVGGTVTVSDTEVTANSLIMVTPQENATGGTINSGRVRVSSRTAGTEFVLTSSSLADDADVGYMVYEP